MSSTRQHFPGAKSWFWGTLMILLQLFLCVPILGPLYSFMKRRILQYLQAPIMPDDCLKGPSQMS